MKVAKYKLLYYSVLGAYFILTLACLIINYIAINKFIIIIYPEDLQTSGRDATQIVAERIHDRIKDTDAFAFYRLLVILISVLFGLSILNIVLVCYMDYLKKVDVSVENTNPENIINPIKNNLEFYKTSII